MTAFRLSRFFYPYYFMVSLQCVQLWIYFLLCTQRCFHLGNHFLSFGTFFTIFSSDIVFPPLPPFSFAGMLIPALLQPSNYLPWHMCSLIYMCLFLFLLCSGEVPQFLSAIYWFTGVFLVLLIYFSLDFGCVNILKNIFQEF